MAQDKRQTSRFSFETLPGVRETLATTRILATRYGHYSESDHEIFVQAGFRDSAEFWAVALSEPMPWKSFVRLFATHSLPPPEIAGDPMATDRANAASELGLDAALKRAMDLGAPFIFAAPAGMMVEPAGMARWLYSLPKRRHLVPPTLQRVLQGSNKPTDVVKGVAKANATEALKKRSQEPRDRAKALLRDAFPKKRLPKRPCDCEKALKPIAAKAHQTLPDRRTLGRAMDDLCKQEGFLRN